MAEYIDKEALCNWCLETGPSYCDNCVMNREGFPAADVRENVIRTQADNLRAMSDEELALFLGDSFSPDGYCWLDWLKQEVDT